MKRREFITLFGSAAASWPLVVRAQQAATPVIGFLSSGAEQAFAPLVAGFIRGLKETGFTERQNVFIEYRWAEGDYGRLPEMANELARRPVTVLVASGGTVAARAAKEATSTIPIVFSTADDPVANGLIASLKSTRRKHHGRCILERRTCREATRARARIDSTGKVGCTAC